MNEPERGQRWSFDLQNYVVLFLDVMGQREEIFRFQLVPDDREEAERVVLATAGFVKELRDRALTVLQPDPNTQFMKSLPPGEQAALSLASRKRGAVKSLSCEALDRSAENLVRGEKRNIARLIAHIAEMSRRKAALELGYKSLFDYCTRRLRLSEGSVALRIQVANVARRFPQLLVALAENRLSLTVAGLLAPHLTAANVETLLSDCEGMTKREAEEHLVSLRPKPVFEPSIRRQPSRPAKAAESQTDTQRGLDGAPAPPPPASPNQDTASPQQAPPKSPTILEPARPEIFNFRFAADRSFKDKFERLAEVLGVENAQRHMAEIFEQALDVALEKKDPKKRLERRKERERKRQTSKTRPRPDEVASKRSTGEPAASRYIPSEVRERVLARAGHQCEYQARDGTRCRSRTGLQIEHERPFALFHSHDERYLRAFCAVHNRFAAERAYGSEFIQSKIDESRNGRASPPARAP